ncbi:MAG: hypothetical protein QW056_05545 [Candidatus Bathyarchaeia archaeon]
MEVKLLVDGEAIPMNEFVEKILASIITSAVGTLKGVGEGWKQIEISIRRQG